MDPEISGSFSMGFYGKKWNSIAYPVVIEEVVTG